MSTLTPLYYVRYIRNRTHMHTVSEQVRFSRGGEEPRETVLMTRAHTLEQAKAKLAKLKKRGDITWAEAYHSTYKERMFTREDIRDNKVLPSIKFGRYPNWGGYPDGGAKVKVI